MTNRGEGFDQLLENRHWLRHLARELLHDRSQVDDVLQNVWMAALNRPPRESNPRSQRSWLKKVLRTFALRANRSDARRHRREGESPEPTPPPTADQMVERLEMQSELAQSIRSLDDPYRTVVFLRFYEERSAADIAATLGIPESTVRTRLSRGLAQLRERLERTANERGTDWRATLLLIVGPEAAAALASSDDLGPTPVTSGATPVIPITGALVALTIAGLLLVAFWNDSAPRRTAPSDARSMASFGLPPDPSVAAAESREPSEAANTDSGPVPTHVEELRRPPSSPESPSTEETAGTRAIEPDGAPRAIVMVIDADSGDPLVGAEVRFTATDRARPASAGRTDAEGCLEVDSTALARDALTVVLDGYVDHHEPVRPRDADGRPYTVELRPRFEARVLVTHRGSPVEGVEVGVHHEERQRTDTITTDAAGVATFWYEDQRTRLTIDAEPYASISVAAGEQTEVELIEAKPVIAILFDERGAPLDDCLVTWTVAETATWALQARSDIRGTIELGRIPAEAVVALEVYPRDRPSYRFRGTPPPEGPWTLEVPRGVYLEGIIETPNPADAARALPFLTVRREVETREAGAIAPMETRRTGRSQRARYRLQPLSRGSVDRDGRFRVGPIPEDVSDVYLLVHHPTLTNQIQPVPDLAQPRPRRIQLETGRRVRGRAVDPDGQPVVGALLHFGERYSNDTESVLGRARTDEEGRFEYPGVPWRTGDRLPEIQVDGRDVVREHVFIAAFPPERIVSFDGTPVESSPVTGAAIVSPSAEDGEIQLVLSTEASDAPKK